MVDEQFGLEFSYCKQNQLRTKAFEFASCSNMTALFTHFDIY